VLSQVLFNDNYRETDAMDEAILLDDTDRHYACGVVYHVHEYCGPLHSPEWYQCMTPGKLSNRHWPHFSLRPGVWSVAKVRALGDIERARDFELHHGLKYAANGLKTGFFPGASSVHLAPSSTMLVTRQHILEDVYARHGLDVAHLGRPVSAYDLSGTRR
jgi:hypothetical protein